MKPNSGFLTVLLITTATQQQFLKTNSQARISSRVLILCLSFLLCLSFGHHPRAKGKQGLAESASSPHACSIYYFLSLLDVLVTRWVSRSRCDNKVFIQNKSLRESGSRVKPRQRMVWLPEGPAKLWPTDKVPSVPGCCPQRPEWPDLYT